MPAVHQIGAGHQAEALGEIFGPIRFSRASQLAAPVGRCGSVMWVVNEDRGLSNVCGIGKYVLDVDMERFRLTKSRTM
ncbi:hypothetical protein R70006_07381 [Paraburkholderia domus]|nr:hypothetical protein R75483_07042 [Paraburkholderia domus]CAE6847053.1 hypothetical protein R70006_07381 [Paraburkholderia domus]